MPIILALSRLNTWFDCARKYFWSYEYKGTGISGFKTPIELAVGGAVHSGLQTILQGGSVDLAVQQGTTVFRDRIAGGVPLQPTEDVLFVYKEQEHFIEALIRVYALKGYPELVREYEIVEVEQEIDLRLGPNVIVRTRADGLLRQRGNGRLYVLSFKTAKKYDYHYSSAGNHDTQGLSESAAIEQIRGEEVLGVQMQYLIKGERGGYGQQQVQQNSALVHPWANNSGEFTTQYKFVGPDGKSHTLGKDWKRCNIWDRMSISEWLDILYTRRDVCLEQSMVTPMPFYRRREEIGDWKDQTQIIGERLLRSREAIAGTPERSALNEHYPQNHRSCDWPSKCPYIDVCFGPAGNEPEETGLYRIRREWKIETD